MKDRFYDKEPGLSQAVELSLVLPEPFRKIVAEFIIELAEGYKTSQPLGRDKVLAIYQAKHKRRAYDQDPLMHEAVNHLTMLSRDGRLLIGVKILKLLGYLEKYLVICRSHGTPPETVVVETIAKTYLNQGGEQVERLVARLENRPIGQNR